MVSKCDPGWPYLASGRRDLCLIRRQICARAPRGTRISFCRPRVSRAPTSSGTSAAKQSGCDSAECRSGTAPFQIMLYLKTHARKHSIETQRALDASEGYLYLGLHPEALEELDRVQEAEREIPTVL